MIGRQEFQPQLFSVVNFEALIPKNHLLRKVDGALDLSFIRSKTEHLYCHDNGRPSVDPELFFRIYLLIFLYNIGSDRQACEEIQYNLAYRWFCRLSLEDRVPDHSSLTKIRDRMGEKIFREIFEHIIGLCREKKLVSGQVMVDGSLIKADAALNSMVERDEKGGPKTGDEPPDYIAGRKYSNKTHVSKTDPECTLAGKIGAPKQLAYKVHNTADRQSRVILDTHVTQGSDHEVHVLIGRLEATELNLGIEIKEVTADRGYGSGENLHALEEREIKSFVPRFRSTAGDRLERDAKGFTYNKKDDRWICPMGHELLPMQGPTPQYKRYRIKGGHCRTCPLKGTCLNLAAMKTRGAKHIEVHVCQDCIERTAKAEKTEAFRKARSERQWKMEGLFAEAKDRHGLGRARYRGRAKMQIQAYMTACVQNIKRLVALMPTFAFLRLWIAKLIEKLLAQNLENFFLSPPPVLP